MPGARSVAPWQYDMAPGDGEAMGLWLWLPVLGPVRTSTVLVAVVMLVLVTVTTRSPLRALAAVIAWTSLFETVYHAVGIVVYHWPLANFLWMTAALAGWVILAAVLGVWPDWRFSIIFLLLMAAWIAYGFHYNVPGQAAPIDIRSEILNESAKTSLALAYLVGALSVSQRIGQTGWQSQPRLYRPFRALRQDRSVEFEASSSRRQESNP